MPVILNVTHSNIYKNQIVKCKNVIRILLKIKIFILSKSRLRLINKAHKLTLERSDRSYEREISRQSKKH
jgi:hypothetical protein